MGEQGMYLSAEQLNPVLKHHWYTTKFTESSLNYVFYHNRSNVKVYTLRFNLRSPNYTDEDMVDTMMKQVMNNFSEEESLFCNTEYDMLLVNNKEDDPSYYVWRANSNQRADSSTEEILLKKEYHEFVGSCTYIIILRVIKGRLYLCLFIHMSKPYLDE